MRVSIFTLLSWDGGSSCTLEIRPYLPDPSSCNNLRNDPQPQGLSGPWVTEGGQKRGPGVPPLYQVPLGAGGCI